MSKPRKQEKSNPGRPLPNRWLQIEWMAAIAVTVWIAALHIINLVHAGPLWRDEVGTVDFATMPSLADIWHNLQYDNFPPLFVAVARVWTMIGLSGDFSLRILGCGIGLATLAVIWLGARTLGARTPLLVLAFYAVNPMAIRVGDSLRPYGLGIALVLLTQALIWKFVQSPQSKTLMWATASAVLSVHCLYQNAIFLVAFSLGAWAVTLARREWKMAGQILLIGMFSAISLLPYYVNIKKGGEWLDIPRMSVDFGSLWAQMMKAMAAPSPWMPPVWGALCLAAMGMAIYCIIRRRDWNMVYCAVVLMGSSVLYLFFLRALGLPPRPWYFLILLANAALAMDAILAGVATRVVWIGRAGGALLIILASIQICYEGVRFRQTNIDLVAAKLKELARPHDLILVSPWYYAVSLQRYFGTNKFTTLPPMEEVRIHRYDLMKRAMTSENPIAPLLADIEGTLGSGGTLWVLGVIQTPPPGQPQPIYPPYHGGMDKADAVYFSSWMFQVGDLIQKHGQSATYIKLPAPDNEPVNSLEDLSLTVIRGWH